MKSIVTILVALSLAGCASLQSFAERHPVATAATVVIIAGSIQASQDSGGSVDHRRSIPSAPCSTPEACR